MQAMVLRLKKRLRTLFDKESKTLFRNSSWVFVANFTGTAYAFLRSVIIARGLGAETLGHYTVAIAFVLTVQEILKLNTGIGIIRFGAQFRSEERPDKIVALIKYGIRASLGSAAVSIGVIAILLTLFYGYFIEVPGLQWFILLYAIVNGISFLDNISKGVLNLYYRFRLNSIVQMIMDTVEFLLVALCIYFFRNDLTWFFTTVICARLINTLICNIAAGIEMKKELGAHLNAPISLLNEQRKELRTYIIGNSLSNTLKTFMNQGDVLVISAWAGPAAVGLYAVAKKLAYSVLTLTDPLVKSIFPQLSMLVYKREFESLKLMLKKITMIITLAAIVAMLPAVIFREWIVLTVYGEQFRQAANLFVIHLAGALQGCIFFWALPLINSLGMATLRLRIYTLAIAVGLLVAWLLPVDSGATGVATGLLCANLMISGLFLWFAWKFIQKEEQIPVVSNLNQNKKRNEVI